MKAIKKRKCNLLLYAICILSILFGGIPVLTEAATLEQQVYAEVALRETNKINISAEIKVLKIVMKQKGKFELNFSPESVYWRSIDAELYDAQGSCLGEVSWSYFKNSSKIQSLDFCNRDLEAGVYYLRIWTESRSGVGEYSYYANVIPAETGNVTVPGDSNTDTVKPANGSAVKKKVSLNKKKIVLKRGKKVQLKLKNNKKSVIWRSQKKSIASVNAKGVVKGRKKGRTYIYAIANNKLYKCKVTVR